MTNTTWGVFIVAALVLAYYVLTRRKSAVSGPASEANAEADAEDERATRMRFDFSLIEKGRTVIADSLVLTAEQQEKTYDVGGRTYVVRHRFGRPTSSFEIVTPDFQSALAVPPYRTSGKESLPLMEGAEVVYERMPLA